MRGEMSEAIAGGIATGGGGGMVAVERLKC